MNKTYKIVENINISITGKNEQINRAIEQFFIIFNPTKESPSYHLQGFAIENMNDQRIPKWIKEYIKNNDIELNPLCFKGPKGEVSIAVTYKKFFYCCFFFQKTRIIQYFEIIPNNNISIFQAIFIPILREILLYKNYILLHSACAYFINGPGVLFVAPSGGGKTTTALSMIRNGAKLISDDLVILKVIDNKTIAIGIHEHINITERTIDFFEETKKYSKPNIYGNLKKTIDPIKVYGNQCLINKCEINIIYFLKKSDKYPEIKPLSINKSLEKLILAHAFTKNQISKSNSVLQLCEILSSVQAYELITGSNPIELGIWLKKILLHLNS